jgi:transposase
MPSSAETAVARTIGIDTGKNTLHMIGLDEKGAIVLRERSLGPGSPHDL